MFWFSENISAGRRLVTFSACTSLRDRGCYLATLQSKLRIFCEPPEEVIKQKIYIIIKRTLLIRTSPIISEDTGCPSPLENTSFFIATEIGEIGIVFLSPSLPETHSKKHFSYLLIHKNLGVVQLWTNFDYSTDQFNPAFKIFLRLCRPNWDWIHEPPQNILMTILLPLQQNFIQYDLQTVARF